LPMKIPELVAPAGSLEKLRYAIEYGADAVYCGLKELNLRIRSENLTLNELREGIAFAHSRKKRVYLVLNALLWNNDLLRLEEMIDEVAALGPDGVIVADPGAINLFRQRAPSISLHLSTQLSTTNWQAVHFWEAQGIRRIILAREVTLHDLSTIRQHTKCELEIFVHGAMCMAYSGRCLLSAYLAQRNANQGDCAQPCRWEYVVQGAAQDGVAIRGIEDSQGTTLLSAKDLCLFDHLPALSEAGIDALKIEGRMKSTFYVAVVTRSYRKALDLYRQNPSAYSTPEAWRNELFTVSHRAYTTGFAIPDAAPLQSFTPESYEQTHQVHGQVVSRENTLHVLDVKAQLAPGDTLEAVTPEKNLMVQVNRLSSLDGEPLELVHPGLRIKAEIAPVLPSYTLLRKAVAD
jgi:putative protease